MRLGVVDTSAKARSFHWAALLLVAACVLSVLVHALAHKTTSISAPLEKTGPKLKAFAKYSGLSASETYRSVENCAGDYVCDGDGPWESMAGTRTDFMQSWPTDTEFNDAAHRSR